MFIKTVAEIPAYVNIKSISLVYIDYWEGYRIKFSLQNGDNITYKLFGTEDSDKEQAVFEMNRMMDRFAALIFTDEDWSDDNETSE